jgi:hypothetical protein
MTMKKRLCLLTIIYLFLSSLCFAYEGDPILDNVQPEGGGTLIVDNIESVDSIDADTETTLEAALDHDDITGAGTVDTEAEVQAVAVGGDLSGTVGSATESDPLSLHTGDTDNIKDTHIDWGSNASQVDTDDIPEGSVNLFFPGFTSLFSDYGFTDNSSNWDDAYGWGDWNGNIDISTDTNLAGTANQIILTDDTLSTPQDIHTGASPTFAGLDLTGLTDTYIPYVGVGALANSPLSTDGTDVTSSGKLLIPDNGYIGSVSDADAVQIQADGDVVLSQGLSLAGTKGIGVYDVPSAQAGLYVHDATFSTINTHYGVNISLTKTAGASDYNDSMTGSNSYMALNQSGGEIGYLYGITSTASLLDGSVGTVVNNRNMYGAGLVAYTNGGTVNGNIYGSVNTANLDAGAITGSVVGTYSNVDIESGVTIGGNVYGHLISVDDDGGAAGTVYGLYISSQTGVDYAIYQGGSAPSVFGGNLTLPSGGEINTASGNLTIAPTGDLNITPTGGDVYLAGNLELSTNNKLIAFTDSVDGQVTGMYLDGSDDLYIGDSTDSDRMYVATSDDIYISAGSGKTIYLRDGTTSNVTIDGEGDVEISGYVGIGKAPASDVALDIENLTVDTEDSFSGMDINITKTAGATGDIGDAVYGFRSAARFDQVGGTLGGLRGGNFGAYIDNGTVDTVVFGLYSTAYIDSGGTLSNAYGLGDLVGAQFGATAVSGSSVSGDIIGLRVSTNAAQDPTNGYAAALEITSGGAYADYGIYQIDATPNYFGGDVLTNGKINMPSNPPASASATGTTGDIAWDSDYIYICVDTDTWKRVAIATW